MPCIFTLLFLLDLYVVMKDPTEQSMLYFYLLDFINQNGDVTMELRTRPPEVEFADVMHHMVSLVVMILYLLGMEEALLQAHDIGAVHLVFGDFFASSTGRWLLISVNYITWKKHKR